MKHKTLWLVLLLSLTGICAASAWILFSKERKGNDLISYGKVPDFSLIAQDGRQVRLRDLDGKVWIADFVFTNCHEACPDMTIRMTGLQSTLGEEDRVRLVSFSVDPERDTPGVLMTYAHQNHAGANWLFLTGDKKQIHQLATKGFFLPIEPEDQNKQILHSQKFVLVDQENQIRGFYDSDTPDSLDQLVQDAQRLLSGES
jgi:protein SCO1/2